MKTMAVFLVGFLASLVVALGEIVVCPKCGFECKPESTNCEQCNAVLPGQAPAVVDNDPQPGTASGNHKFDAGGKLESLGADTVNDEVRLARKYMDAGNLALARLVFRNAQALEKLTRSDAGTSRAGALKEYIQRCEKLAGAVHQECPVCSDGTKTRMKVTTISGETKYHDVANTICPRCSGSRFIVKPETISQWKEKMARAAVQLGAVEKQRKFVAVNGVYVPADIRDRLTLVQRAALGRVVHVQCPDCEGIGMADCPGCLGLGEVKCSAKGCQMGQVAVDAGGQLIKSKIVRTEKCATCSGTGAVACADCEGIGRTKCRKCKGTGLAPACKKCEGTGLVDCRKCKGTGTFKDQPCPDCAGEGKALCPLCGNAE